MRASSLHISRFHPEVPRRPSLLEGFAVRRRASLGMTFRLGRRGRPAVTPWCGLPACTSRAPTDGVGGGNLQSSIFNLQFTLISADRNSQFAIRNSQSGSAGISAGTSLQSVASMTDPVACPACGTPQTQTGWAEELCPSCLLRLALQPLSRQSRARRARDRLHPRATRVHCRRARCWATATACARCWARGGMGEVWRAFDLKLRVEVALKALRAGSVPGRAAARDAALRGPRRPRGGVAQRVPDLRPDRGGRHRAGVDGVRGRPDAAPSAPGARAARAEGGAGHRVAVPGRAGGDPQGGAGPPRRQAREHHGDPGGAGGGDGLRAGAAGGQRRRHGGGDAGVHGAGAGGRAAGGRAGGRLLGGCGAGRDGEPGRDQELREPAERVGGGAVGAGEAAGHAVGAGAREGGGEGAGAALQLGAHADPGARGRDAAGRGRRGPAPLPGPGLVHRSRRGVLLRPRGRGRADVAQARAAAPAWRRGSIRGRQDLVPQGGADSERPAGWAIVALHSRKHADSLARAVRWHRDGRRRRGGATCCSRFDDPDVAVERVFPLAQRRTIRRS